MGINDNKMEEQKRTTWEYMLHYGALLGLFWVFQYLFFIGEAFWVHFIYFYHLLNIVSPLLMYIFYLKYRGSTPDINHNLWRCVLFVVVICFLGSFFDAAIRYAHYAFINPDVFANLSAAGVGLAEGWLQAFEKGGGFKDWPAEQIEALRNQYMVMMNSKWPYIIGEMISRVFWGFVFSFLIYFLTKDRNYTLNK